MFYFTVWTNLGQTLYEQLRPMPGFLKGVKGFQTARGRRQGAHGPPDPGERSDTPTMQDVVDKNRRFWHKPAVAERLVLKAADREDASSIPALTLHILFLRRVLVCWVFVWRFLVLRELMSQVLVSSVLVSSVLVQRVLVSRVIVSRSSCNGCS